MHLVKKNKRRKKFQMTILSKEKLRLKMFGSDTLKERVTGFSKASI